MSTSSVVKLNCVHGRLWQCASAWTTPWMSALLTRIVSSFKPTRTMTNLFFVYVLSPLSWKPSSPQCALRTAFPLKLSDLSVLAFVWNPYSSSVTMLIIIVAPECTRQVANRSFHETSLSRAGASTLPSILISWELICTYRENAGVNVTLNTPNGFTFSDSDFALYE